MIIPHNKPTLGIEEEQAALRVLKSGWISQGPEVEFFENEFCNYIGLPRGHAVAVTSGSAALFLALWALNATRKKIVYPSYVCSALRNAVMLIGGNEKLVDIASNSPNIDTKMLFNNDFDIAIIPHMYGIPIDLSEFDSNYIIEDCCQSLGAKVNGKSVGLQGVIGIFSFHATKLITSGGQGGMVVSKDKRIVDAIRSYRDYGPQDNKMRFNFQLTDLQAAIGREQLRKLPFFLSRREKIFSKYKNAGIDLLDIKEIDKNKLFPVRFRAIARTKHPTKITRSLESIGVKATILIDNEGLLGDATLFPNAANLAKETVSLPIYPSLTDEDVEKILNHIV